MTSLVLQLQELAADDSSSVAELLRKARMVATKLKLTDFNDWITHELHGYNDIETTDQLRDYRVIKGDIRAHNPTNGVLMPIRFDPETTRKLSTVYVAQSIGDLDDLVKDRSVSLQFPFSEYQVAKIHQMMDSFHRSWVLPFRMVEASRIVAILDRVRNIILDWSLQLESEGLLGDGMTFSDDDRKRAAGAVIRIHNFQGILGDVRDSKVTQKLDMKVKAGDLQSLKDYLQSFGLRDADVDELQQAIEADPQPEKHGQFGDNVAGWIGRTVGKAATGAYDIAIGAAGDLLASAIGAFYGLS